MGHKYTMCSLKLRMLTGVCFLHLWWWIFHNKEYTILSFPTYQATQTLLLQAFKIGYCSNMPYCYHKQVHPRRVNSKNRSCNGICELPFQFHVTLHFFPTFLVVFQCHIKSVYPTILDVVRHKMYEEETRLQLGVLFSVLRTELCGITLCLFKHSKCPWLALL